MSSISSSSIDSCMDGILATPLGNSTGLALGVASGDSSGETTFIRGIGEIAGSEVAEGDVELVEIGNGDPCGSNGNCIDADDPADAALPPSPRGDGDCPPPLPRPLLLLLTPRLAHKNAHISAGNEFDCWEVLPETVVEFGLGVDASG